MSSTYKFDGFNDLINFMFTAKNVDDEYKTAFDDWEVTFIALKISQGLELSLNTKIIDTNGINEYQTWRHIKTIVKSYLSQNMSQEFTNIEWYDRILLQVSKLDIRFRCPKHLKDVFDPNAEYDSFRLNFTVDSGMNLLMVNAVEKSFPVTPESYRDWNLYMDGIISRWERENN